MFLGTAIETAHERAGTLIAAYGLEGRAADKAALLVGTKSLRAAIDALRNRFYLKWRSPALEDRDTRIERDAESAYYYGRIALSCGRRLRLAIVAVEKALKAVEEFDAVLAADPGEGEE